MTMKAINEILVTLEFHNKQGTNAHAEINDICVKAVEDHQKDLKSSIERAKT